MQQFREMSTERTKAYRSTIGFGVVVLTLGKFQTGPEPGFIIHKLM
jgi:hypothetical protein